MLIFSLISFIAWLSIISSYQLRLSYSLRKSDFSKLFFSTNSISMSTNTIKSESSGTAITPKTVTKDIMIFFNLISTSRDIDERQLATFQTKLLSKEVNDNLDGMHIITILFQTARSKKLVKNIVPISIMIEKLKSWDKEWSERDISTFIYGIRSLDCINPLESELLLLGAAKMKESNVLLTSSRSIGNALYGLQDITSNVIGIKEICNILATKIDYYRGDLIGQDIGIGIYGLQGMSADSIEIKALIKVLANKINNSVTEFDAQALSNSLYGLQSMSSDYSEVLLLVSALATKVSESKSDLIAQAIGSALYGLQKLSSDALEVFDCITQFI